MTPQAPAFAFLRRSLMLWTITGAFFATIAQAGINTRVTSDTTVFRVGEKGRSTIAGKLKAGDQVEVLGFRTSFDWIRIRYQGDEGYILKSAVKELELTKDYFDPAGDKLGRRKEGSSHELSTASAKGPVESKFGLSANLSFNDATGLGAGAGLIYRSFSWESSGYDFGIDGTFYFMNEFKPYTGYLFYRYWTPGKLKIGAEAFLSLSGIAVTIPDVESTVLLSAGAGAYLGIPLSSKVLLAPGVRVNIWGGIDATGVFGMTFSL